MGRTGVGPMGPRSAADGSAVLPLVRNIGPPVTSDAMSGTRGRKNVLGASDRRELTMKTRQRDPMHEIRAVVGSIWAAALKGRGCILDNGDLETKISRHPRRTRHAVVGGEPPITPLTAFAYGVYYGLRPIGLGGAMR